MNSTFFSRVKSRAHVIGKQLYESVDLNLAVSTGQGFYQDWGGQFGIITYLP